MTMARVTRSSPLLALAAQHLLILRSPSPLFCLAQDSSNSTSSTPSSSNLDQFTYRTSDYESSVNSMYPPDQWGSVRCSDVTQCLGWPDNFLTANGWDLRENDCKWCPLEGDGDGGCSSDHQSPIDLDRNTAILGDANANECIDVHWMKYHDSSCSWNELTRLNAFSIERHALKVVQPVALQTGTTDTWHVQCNDGSGRRFGRIDFSKGFSEWWQLSHMDVHVPSEHAQEGHRFSGEIQLYHFYSVSEEEAGVANQMATIAVFLEAYDDVPDYDVLNKLICQWRKVEDATRAACGLPSVYDEYPGCFLYRRGYDNTTTPADLDGGTVESRNLRASPQAKESFDEAMMKPAPPLPPKALSPLDVLTRNISPGDGDGGKVRNRVLVSDEDKSDGDQVDWDAFIADVYAKEEEQRNLHGRRLMLDYGHVDYYNYFPMLGCKTEYYFRYMGTQTVPPCYATFNSGGDNGLQNRGNTNHWRVMKDPIRVSNRQILELHRLIRDRVAPPDDPLRACKPDTAAAPNPDDERKISVARPLQKTQNVHFETFCECKDWKSKWLEDQAWCELPENTRLFDRPYNYETAGF